MWNPIREVALAAPFVGPRACGARLAVCMGGLRAQARGAPSTPVSGGPRAPSPLGTSRTTYMRTHISLVVVPTTRLDPTFSVASSCVCVCVATFILSYGIRPDLRI